MTFTFSPAAKTSSTAKLVPGPLLTFSCTVEIAGAARAAAADATSPTAATTEIKVFFKIVIMLFPSIKFVLCNWAISIPHRQNI